MTESKKRPKNSKQTQKQTQKPNFITLRINFKSSDVTTRDFEII